MFAARARDVNRHREIDGRDEEVSCAAGEELIPEDRLLLSLNHQTEDRLVNVVGGLWRTQPIR